MKLSVDEVKCQHHGQCTISAPTNFELDEEGRLRYRESFEEDVLGDVEDAADACPVQAILVHDDARDG